MHVLLYLSADGFYTSHLVSAHPELCGKPIVVHRDAIVIDTSSEARASLVVPGMSLREAKTILRENGRFVDLKDFDFGCASDEWLAPAADYSDAIQRDTLSSAWIDLSMHPDPTDVAMKLIARMGESGLRHRSGLSRSKWIAKLDAECSVVSAPLGIPCLTLIDDCAAFLAPLPTSLLLPVEEKIRDRLIFLGYRRIGQVAKAASTLLKEQFGKKGVVVSQIANGNSFEQLTPNFPDQSVTEAKQFEPPLDLRMDLHNACDQLATQLASRLCQSDQIAKELIVTVEDELGEFHRFNRTLAKPIQEATLLKTACRYALDQITINERIVQMRIRMTGLKPCRQFQSALDHRWNPEDGVRLINSARTQIAGCYGEKSVQLASELRSPRRVRLLRVWQNATGWH